MGRAELPVVDNVFVPDERKVAVRRRLKRASGQVEIEARIVGIFKMRDKGQNDFKLLAVPNKDPLFADIKRLEDVPHHFLLSHAELIVAE